MGGALRGPRSHGPNRQCHCTTPRSPLVLSPLSKRRHCLSQCDTHSRRYCAPSRAQVSSKEPYLFSEEPDLFSKEPYTCLSRRHRLCQHDTHILRCVTHILRYRAPGRALISKRAPSFLKRALIRVESARSWANPGSL